MDKLTLLILVVIAGFAICWFSLRRIATYTYQCALKLLDIESTLDEISNLAGQTQVAIEELKEHIEERFPTPPEHDDLL
jgi:hypothetical protein